MRKIKIVLVVSLLLFNMVGCSKKEKNEPVFQTLPNQLLSGNITIDTTEPYRFEIVKEESVLAKQKTVYRDPGDSDDGYWWLANKVNIGSPKKKETYYRITYDVYGNQISKVEIPDSTTIKEAEPVVYEYYGEVEVGAVFFPSDIWRYGSDCRACYPDEYGYSGLSSGIAVGTHSVRQYDGTWEEGITYEGYYLVASSTKLPLCTVLEISNHSFKGEGLEPYVPFKAVIADRGVPQNTLDLFVGSEKNLGIVKMTNSRHKPKVTIISFGSVVRNSKGQRTCKI